MGDSKPGGGGLGVSGRKETRARSGGGGAAAGLGPPQKSMGVPTRGLSFAELGTRHRRWRRRWQRFGLRLGPPKGSRRRGGRGRVSAGLEAAGGVARGPEPPGALAAVSAPPARRSAASRARKGGARPPPHSDAWLARPLVARLGHALSLSPVIPNPGPWLLQFCTCNGPGLIRPNPHQPRGDVCTLRYLQPQPVD